MLVDQQDTAADQHEAAVLGAANMPMTAG